jgi:hypothetical protein
MDVALGLLGIAAWIVTVIAIAAAITFAVVKIFPSERPEKPSSPP